MGNEHRHIRGGLLLYHRPMFSDAATIDEHIDSFGRHSRFRFWKVNTDLGFPGRLAGLSFDAVVLHYTLFASGPFPYQLNDPFLSYLAEDERSYKVAFFQDEHEYCQRRFRFLDRYGVDCVYTCFEPEYFAATYGKYTRVPKLVSHVPAYVSSDLIEAAERLSLPDDERTIDIGYRTRPVPPWIGRGGMEKVEIGERFAERARDAGLRLDISMREEDRLYGEEWYRFVATCRGFLGTESGASCVDLEDEVREEYDRLSAGGRDVSTDELERGALGRWDGKVQLRTTASRHFEAAALRTCQLMYEGRYSGALRPMEHYIPLKKDFSNFDEVLDLFGDPEVRRTLTDNAYRDLIASGEHSYERFIAGFDSTLEEAGLQPAERAPDTALVRRSIRWKPPRSVLARYLVGSWFWLMQNHPRIWRVLHVASRPVVWPARRILGLPSGGDPASGASPRF